MEERGGRGPRAAPAPPRAREEEPAGGATEPMATFKLPTPRKGLGT